MKLFFQTIIICIMLGSCGNVVINKEQPYSQRMVESLALRTFLSGGEQQLATARWGYVPGLVANSVLKTWMLYPEKTEYYQVVKQFADFNILEGDSVIAEPHNIDDLPAGKIFFVLYRTEMEKGNEADALKYKRCADFLRNKLKYNHRRIDASKPGGGRWIHKARYPGQMWLDGLYMGPALYAEWQHYFWEEEGVGANMESWTDIALQFEVIFQYTWDSEKQLNYHAWASNPDDPNAFWAQKEGTFRGASHEFWGRGVGWYFAALVDVLEWMPAQHPNRPRLEEILRLVAVGLAKYQDDKSGCWYQLLQYDATKCADDVGDTMDGAVYFNQCNHCNYLESSASSMFTYAFLKGIRLKLLDKATFLPVARKAYQGLIDTFIREGEDGYLNIIQSCNSAGLGPANNLSRTGTVNYYLCGSDTFVTQNEGKAIGPFIMASIEAEMAGIDN
jgi:unsaturated rhamnogalacturonyl hydrolase